MNQTSLVYGKAYIDLNVGLNGPFQALNLTGNVNLFLSDYRQAVAYHPSPQDVFAHQVVTAFGVHGVNEVSSALYGNPVVAVFRHLTGNVNLLNNTVLDYVLRNSSPELKDHARVTVESKLKRVPSMTTSVPAFRNANCPSMEGRSSGMG